jgi:hypothetical protein
VPKVAHAGARISVAFRHDLDWRAYAGKVTHTHAGMALPGSEDEH